MATIEDMTDEVRMLELELRKLELNKLIAQAKADTLGTEMYNLKETISDLLHNDMQLNVFIDEYQETVKNRDETIKDLKSNFGEHYHQISKQAIEIDALEAELSARKGDSAVLMEVVEAIIAWNSSPIQPRDTIKRIKHAIHDYLDAPVISTEEEHCVTVKVGFLELP